MVIQRNFLEIDRQPTPNLLMKAESSPIQPLSVNFCIQNDSEIQKQKQRGKKNTAKIYGIFHKKANKRTRELIEKCNSRSLAIWGIKRSN
jgi:hypothetical protein